MLAHGRVRQRWRPYHSARSKTHVVIGDITYRQKEVARRALGQPAMTWRMLSLTLQPMLAEETGTIVPLVNFTETQWYGGNLWRGIAQSRQAGCEAIFFF